MQKNKKERIKGKNWFVNEYGVIYVCGTIDKKYRRVSTGMEATARNLKWIDAKPKGEPYSNAMAKLIELTTQKDQVKTDFENFGRETLEKGAKKKRPDGSWSKKGRGKQAQTNALKSFYKHLIPYFGELSLEEITVHHVEDWQEMKVEEQGFSTGTVSKWRSWLHEIMERALKYDLVTKNVVALADTIEIIHQKREGYTPEEARQMMVRSEGIMRAWTHLGFTTGLRPGEMKGLKVQDLDFDYGVGYVARSITESEVIEYETSTKNHNRFFYLLPEVAEVLKEHVKGKSPEDWVFSRKDGNFYHTSWTIKHKYLDPLLKKVGVKRKGTLGMMRKTFATIGKSYAMDESFRQELMGHTEGSDVTDKHYTFMFMTKQLAEEGRQKLNPLNDVLFGRKTKEA